MNPLPPARLTIVLLALVAVPFLASCSSEPEKQKHEERVIPLVDTPPPADPEASAVVDELAAAEIPAWGERVLKLEKGILERVARELSRRAMEAGEAMTEDALEPPKELMAVKFLLGKKGSLFNAMMDVIVWSSLHAGRQGMFQVFNYGIQALPSTLKCRRDKHKFVPGMIGYIWADFLLGSFRNKMLTDSKVREFFQKELKTCPPEFRAHYEAVLAALGDASHLDVLPALMRSPVLADQQLAHLFVFGMFWEQSPYQDNEISGKPGSDMSVSIPNAEEAPWKPIQERALKWWDEHRDEMKYDAEAKRWRLK